MYQPSNNEYGQFYEEYIKLVENNVIEKLESQLREVEEILAEIPTEKHNYAYAESKWTIKQLVSHLIDTERVMVYRAMRFARNDATELPGFDQDAYVASTNIDHLDYTNLMEEFLLLRQANLHFFKSLTEEDYSKTGRANGSPLSVGALLFIIAGHVDHHLNILKERYL